MRCFADPGAHRREDRDPSCSVNVLNGAWRCHACGARGGAYDAALAKGHNPRSAIDLMISHGLTERRARLQTARELLNTPADRAQPTPIAHRGRETERAPLGHGSRHPPLARGALPPARPPGRLSDQRGWRWQTHPCARARPRSRPDHDPDPQPPRIAPRPAPLPTRADEPPEDARVHRNPPRAIPTPPPRPPNASCSSRAPGHDRRPLARPARDRRTRRPRLATRLGKAARRAPDHDHHGRRPARPQRRPAHRRRPRRNSQPPDPRARTHRNDGYDLTDWLLEYSAIELEALR